ncbi:vacuolar protein sorting-associated protein 33A-like [Tigriopus californicus]|uniref:vacuolar protein sorting-associated protein 33A-like n=1 Tax=Tigriopus californicus TaxID=6832 RepID=UPI0027DA7153|nr:vacuolar protein sorting-associated protein 33A-like [Tigriopus californicus]
MIQFDLLRDLARRELLDHLDKYAGTKVLVWDEGLTAPLDLIAKHSVLRERQVDKMVPLKAGRLPVDLGQFDNVVFMVRPDVHLMDAVADNVQREESAHGTRAEFHIMFVPQRSLLCEMRLKEKEVFGSFTFLDELSLFWFPLDIDVISMENRSVFRDYHLNDDPTCLNRVAKGILALQSVFGVIPKVYGKGPAARQVYEFMVQMRKESIAHENPVIGKIDSLIIIDRQIDLITPFLTQLTYEGLIDETFGIKFNSVRLPAHKFKAPDSPNDDFDDPDPFEMKTIPLHSGEDMFCELRDKNFNAVGPTLSKKAKYVSSQFEERHEAKTVQELKSFVDKLPQMKILKQSLSIHTTIAELVKKATDDRRFLENLQVEQELVNFQNADRPLDYLEDACCHEEEIVKVLRLICLQNVVNSGVKPKILEHYRRLILQTYGYKHLLTLQSLERLGLLNLQSQVSRNYPVLRKRLNLTMDDTDEQDPSDIAYVHSVYAPLSVRLVQNFAHPGWQSIKDVLELLPGPTVAETQNVPANLKKVKDENHQATTLVLFVGGCTFAEISALRFLSQREESNTEFLVATTALINGDTFVESLMTQVDDNLAPRFV